MLPSFSSLSSWLIDVHVSTVGFKVSKHVMERGITTCKSHLKASQITFPCGHQIFNNP
jgi:hypothetical protein